MLQAKHVRALHNLPRLCKACAVVAVHGYVLLSPAPNPLPLGVLTPCVTDRTTELTPGVLWLVVLPLCHGHLARGGRDLEGVPRWRPGGRRSHG